MKSLRVFASIHYYFHFLQIIHFYADAESITELVRFQAYIIACGKRLEHFLLVG